jgi:hypothetical protein
VIFFYQASLRDALDSAVRLGPKAFASQAPVMAPRPQALILMAREDIYELSRLSEKMYQLRHLLG